MTGEMQDRMIFEFWEQANRVLSLVPEHGVGPLNHVGAELELYLVKQGTGINGIPSALAPVNLTQKVIDETTWASSELGGSAVELNPPPIFLSDPFDFEMLFAYLNRIEEELSLSAKKHGLEVLRSGTVPDVSATGLPPAPKEKYKQVPGFHNKKRPGFWGRLNGVDLRDPMIIGLCNAFQINLEVASQEEAIDILNRMFMITPMALALGHNARFLQGRDTGFVDVRNIAWRISHDTRSWWEVLSGKNLRIGLPKDYFRDMRGYLAEVSSYPFILEHPEAALPIGIGLFWRDARIKFINGAPVVEFRPLSTQPTLEKEIALTAFVLGRLYWSIDYYEYLTPMLKVRQQKRQAECYGFFPDLEKELMRAKLGLKSRGLYDCGVGEILDSLFP